jgi:hypothetical protein
MLQEDFKNPEYIHTLFSPFFLDITQIINSPLDKNTHVHLGNQLDLVGDKPIFVKFHAYAVCMIEVIIYLLNKTYGTIFLKKKHIEQFWCHVY